MCFLYQKMKELFQPLKFMIYLAMGHLCQSLGHNASVAHFESAYKVCVGKYCGVKEFYSMRGMLRINCFV